MKACPALEDLVLYEGTMTHASDDVKQYLDSEEDSGYHGSDDDMTMNNLLEAFDLSCTKEWMWDPYPQFGLKRVLRGGFLPNLTSLTLNIDHVDESWMLEVLEALPMHQLQYVDLCGATARDIKELVERQHKSLKDMHLRGLHYAEEEDQDGHDDIQGSVNHSGAHNLGSAVCNILASCSQLRTLIILAGMLEEFDIRHLIAQPWVCMALRTLEIPVVLAHKCSDPRLLRHAEAEKRQAAWQGRLPRQLPPLLQSDEAQYDVQLSQSAEELEEWDQCEVVWMKYLGQLNQLRVLKLRRALGTISDKLAEPIYLTWTMSLGLGYLKNLTLLEHLRLPPHSVLQDECEWMFMKQHWPKLRMLQTRLGLPLLETYKNQIHEVWPELTVK
ncbi:hypothetical protein BGZ73_002204 [Actinomortierella ambigua]|nr:hypothetical protein BGZ73_002204 [Actinomortierella ambigua]